MTSPSSQDASEETALERAKREANAALAIERAKSEEEDYARTLELSNFSEMNDRLQNTIDLILNKAEESEAPLAAEKEEKAELLKKLQELANAEAMRQAKYEADNAKRMKEVEEDKARLVTKKHLKPSP